MLVLAAIILIDSVIKWNQIITARKAGKSMATISKNVTAK